MTVRAKFKFNSYTTFIQRGQRKEGAAANDYSDAAYNMVEARTLNFSPVSDGSEENRRFWASSPGGRLELNCVNPAAWAQFDLNANYYLDFVPAEA